MMQRSSNQKVGHASREGCGCCATEGRSRETIAIAYLCFEWILHLWLCRRCIKIYRYDVLVQSGTILNIRCIYVAVKSSHFYKAWTTYFNPIGSVYVIVI